MLKGELGHYQALGVLSLHQVLFHIWCGDSLQLGQSIIETILQQYPGWTKLKEPHSTPLAASSWCPWWRDASCFCWQSQVLDNVSHLHFHTPVLIAAPSSLCAQEGLKCPWRSGYFWVAHARIAQFCQHCIPGTHVVLPFPSIHAVL